MIKRKDVPLPFANGKNANAKKKEQTAQASKYPQGYFKSKPCEHCDVPFIPNAPSEKYCSDKCKDIGICNAYLKRTYNITVEEYIDMYISQNGKCKLCSSSGYAMSTTHNNHSVKLVVDHCHYTQKVRGLLCHDCNRALGLLKDNLEVITAIPSYLNERAETIPKGSTPKSVEAVCILSGN